MNGELTPELRQVLEGAKRFEAGIPDPFDFPPHVGRAINQVRGRYWNVNLPEMAEIRCVSVAPDPHLSTPRLNVVCFLPPRPQAGAIVYIHGGGWAYSPVTLDEHFARSLALASGLPVLAVDYGLAPERQFPGPVHDVVAAWRAIWAEPARFGIAPGRLALAGDSAGANLALAAMLYEQASGRMAPDAAALIYGVFQYYPASPSMLRFGEIAGPPARHMEAFWDWYIPDSTMRHMNFLAAPLLASDAQLLALPPVTLLWAEVDTLAHDSEVMAQRLLGLRSVDKMLIEPGVTHGFLQMGAYLEAARRCTEALAVSINQHLMAL